MALSLKAMVQKQVTRVLERGSRAERFDQIRNRHFWSTHLFLADPNTDTIQAGRYDIFKVIPSGVGQGYPTNVPLTTRETNWLNGGRVPDNQNFVITEVGVTLKRPPAVDGSTGLTVAPLTPPNNGIWANLTPAMQAYINGGAQFREINSLDAMAILYGGLLEMSFLTNNVPLGLLADFSQSSGEYIQGHCDTFGNLGSVENANASGFGDPVNGIPAAAFRRKLEVPILLQHGENMGMVINFPKNIAVTSPNSGVKFGQNVKGTGWFEIRVDWWAYESFTEKS